MEWAAVISAALTIIGLVVRAYLAKEPERSQEDAHDAQQELRKAIADGDADAVGIAIDSVPAAPGDHPAEQRSDEDTARRLAEITGG